jgi:predicted transglutaminase-like cysteine proteinase
MSTVSIRTLRIFFLIAVCCSAAFADMHPSQSSPSADAGNMPDVQAEPEKKTSERVTPRPGAEPFDLSVRVSPGEMPAKWNELQSRILGDERALAACRSDESSCSDAARRFLSIVALGQKHEGRARFGWINRAVNLSIRPTSDWAQYGYADYWASPLQTLGSGAGDCEDYAIVKYVVLRELGVDESDLRFVIVHDDKHQADHAIVAIRHEQRWLILDNRTMAILNAEEVQYRPMFALDQQNARTVAAAAVDRIINR